MAKKAQKTCKMKLSSVAEKFLKLFLKKYLTKNFIFGIIVERLRKVSSVGRASALQAEGHRFEPCTFHQEILSHFENGLVAQLVRALACHARGRGFEPHPSRHSRANNFHRSASVAQLVEQRTENPRVVGSIPTGGTIYADLAHLVERHLAKVEVAGSSPVIRSKERP